jgi:hypothetical protein
MKPRIRLAWDSGWVCFDDTIEQHGSTPLQAYLNWSEFSQRYAFRKKTAKPLRRKQDAAPIKHGPSIDVARVQKADPIEPPPYSEAIVRQVPGTLQRPAYVPPRNWRMAVERAAAVQPPMVSVSGAGPAGRSLGGHEDNE